MAHSHTYEAIVLKTYDVGEADRFLVLFTRERGRITARAKAVRKLTSRMGGHLLPFRHLHIGLVEGSAGLIVTGAQLVDNERSYGASMAQFIAAEQGVELLLQMLHDEEPLPDIFESALLFLHHCFEKNWNPITPFSLCVLSLMGLLPDTETTHIFGKLSPEEKTYIHNCLKNTWQQAPEHTERKILTMCQKLLSLQSSRPSVVPSIAATL